jgi:hypothetical protein
LGELCVGEECCCLVDGFFWQCFDVDLRCGRVCRFAGFWDGVLLIEWAGISVEGVSGNLEGNRVSEIQMYWQ